MFGKFILNFQLSYLSFYLFIQFFKRAIIDEYMISHCHAFGDILFRRIGIFHFPLFVVDEFFVRYMIALIISQYHSFVSDLGIRIDGEQVEITLVLEHFSFTYGSDAFDNRILSADLRLFVQLLDDVGRAVFRTEVIGNDDHTIPIDRHPSLLYLLDQICPHGKMLESFLLDEVVYDSAFTGAKRSGDSDDDHLLVVRG